MVNECSPFDILCKSHLHLVYSKKDSLTAKSHASLLMKGLSCKQGETQLTHILFLTVSHCVWPKNSLLFSWLQHLTSFLQFFCTSPLISTPLWSFFFLHIQTHNLPANSLLLLCSFNVNLFQGTLRKMHSPVFEQVVINTVELFKE